MYTGCTRERRVGGWVCLYVRRSNDGALRPQQGAVGSIDMPSPRISCNFSCAGRSNRRTEQPGGEQINEPNRSRRTYQDFEALANDPPLFSSLWDEAYIGSGENDKRYRRHHPASWPRRTACRYLSLQFQTIQSGSHARYPITTTVQP